MWSHGLHFFAQARLPIPPYTHAIRSSNHPFVTGFTFLGGLAPLMNGAAVQVFPGEASPINLIATLVNYPQTRKSQNTKLAKTIAEALDQHVATLTKQEVSRCLAAQRQNTACDERTEQAPKLPKLQVSSSTIASFTPEVFFERFSGDYQQLQNSNDIGAEDAPIELIPCGGFCKWESSASSLS